LEDLSSIKTLGFRGEALASIAAVSKMAITSRYVQNPPSPPFEKGGEGGDLISAHEIRLEGGNIVFEGPSAHPPGTTVLVKYLFYQTPARLKFLKSSETEMSHIIDSVTRVALANPQGAIRLTHNGKKVLGSGGEGGLKSTLASLFDEETAAQTWEVAGGNRDITVSGLAGHPSISRSHQRDLYLFVNGRPVRDKVLFHAVMEAYRNTLMRGRYPFAVIFLNLPGEMVDVNVHPAKAEVRFADSRLVHHAVQEAVRKTLEGEPWKAGARVEGIGSRVMPEANEPALLFSMARIPDLVVSGNPKPQTLNPKPCEPLTPIGQILGTYLVCETPDKLVLIDQHAAHERILFDRLLTQYKEGNIASQPLLIPENFDLPPSSAEILKKYLKELERFGLEIEFFGGCTFIVRAVPVLLQGKVSIKNLALDIAGDQVEKGRLVSLTDNLNDLLARMACHSAVRANRRLTVSEIKPLLDDLERYPLTSFCPHGRPVAVEISQRELEKWFKRAL
ncbi:MAG: DNA mismatch repair endonuclease MutL, partial [Deltaproteobacteria bacterium]|nr:DNA mismatch repair endonuclease MutL [Deltaproteobacteria bacterium]